MGVYSRRNLRILYDAISTLAEAAAPALQAPEQRALLMPPLTTKWATLADDDKELLPLLECYTAVAQALGAWLMRLFGCSCVACTTFVDTHITSSQHHHVKPRHLLRPGL